MKKRILCILLSAVIILATFHFAAIATVSTVPQFFAKAGEPTIDGVINPSEYGAVYTMDESNSSTWNGGTEAPVSNVSFAWSDKGINIAVSSPDAVAGDMFQIALNIGDMIPDGNAGVFYTFIAKGNDDLQVLRHNFQTTDVEDNTDGMPQGFDISDKVTAKLSFSSTGMVLEVLIPTKELQVKGVGALSNVDCTSFTPTAGTTMGMVLCEIYSGLAWTTAAGANATPEGAIGAIVDVSKFGTLSFQPLNTTTPQFFAKASEPTIDGTIKSKEYGIVYTMDESNSSTWNGGAEAPVSNVSFAWSDKGINIAVSSPDAVAGDMFQIALNIGNKIPNGNAGVFYTFIAKGNDDLQVLRHNFQTTDVEDNTDGMPQGFDISDKVTAKLSFSSTGMVLEVLIPTKELQVKGVGALSNVDCTSFTPTAGTTMGMVLCEIYGGLAWTTAAGANATPEGAIGAITDVSKFGTLSFLSNGSNSTPTSSTPTSSTPTSSTPTSSTLTSSTPDSSISGNSQINNSTPDTNPKTGDNTIIFVTIFLLAGTSITFFALRKNTVISNK